MIDWNAVIQEHGPSVWRTAYRLLGNRSDADDCLQETFVAAVAAAEREPIRNWSALLSRLAVYRSVDILRRRSRQTLRSLDDTGMPEAVSRDCSPVAVAQKGELTARLRAALAKLPRRQAEVVCLRYLSEMSYEEISDQLQIDVRHVGVVLSRAREKLRELLRDGGADHG